MRLPHSVSNSCPAARDGEADNALASFFVSFVLSWPGAYGGWGRVVHPQEGYAGGSSQV